MSKVPTQQNLKSKSKIKKITIISLLSILIVGGIVFVFINFSKGKSQDTPKIEISPLEYDAGTVSMSAGLVKKTYEIKNVGNGNLEIDNIWTSCACTTAILKIGDRISPEFTMPGHKMAPIFWSETLKPGERGELEVIFDPAFHGLQGIGQALRAVYLSTNDPQNKKVEVKLLANIIP